MTNKNRNTINKQQNKEHGNMNKKRGKGEKGLDARIAINIISIVVSCFALVVSGLMLYVNYYFNNKEYEYKIDPEVEITGGLGIQVHQNGEQHNAETFLEDLQIYILQKNNLQDAYLIYPDNTVEKLTIDDMEQRLISELNEDLKMNRSDMKFGTISYHYVFLFLEGLDETSELYLIYMKSDDGVINFYGVSGIEVWGFANSNQQNKDYEGERVMAEQYLRILEESRKYMM